jgi:hypothetical protein
MSLHDAHFHQITTVDGTTAGTPLADQFDTTISSDIVCMSKYNKCYFLYYWGTNLSITNAISCIIGVLTQVRRGQKR